MMSSMARAYPALRPAGRRPARRSRRSAPGRAPSPAARLHRANAWRPAVGSGRAPPAARAAMRRQIASSGSGRGSGSASPAGAACRSTASSIARRGCRAVQQPNRKGARQAQREQRRPSRSPPPPPARSGRGRQPHPPRPAAPGSPPSPPAPRSPAPGGSPASARRVSASISARVHGASSPPAGRRGRTARRSD